MFLQSTIIELNQVCQFIKGLLQTELKSQGHRATGDLIESISYQIIPDRLGVTLNFYMLYYSTFVENGRRAGARKVPIEVLLRWMRIKGIGDSRTEESIAYAIQTAIFKEGIPTRGAYDHTSNGRRLEFQSYVLDFYQDEINQLIDDALEFDFNSQFDNILKTA